MKTVISIFRKRAGTLNCVLLALYTAFALFSQSFSQKIVSVGYPWSYYAVSLLFCVIIAVIISPFVIEFFSRFGIGAGENGTVKTEKQAVKRDLALFAAVFSVFLVYFISFYPGALSPDSVNQYDQAINNTYNDWHPALHTLLAFKLPLLLTGGWVGSIVLTQLIWLSAVLTYAFKVIYKYTNRKYALVSMLFVLLNPQTGSITLFPWKDIAFGICALLMLTYALQIFLTKGEWIRSPLNTAAFVVISAVTTVMRHNAVLFTVPLLFAVMFFIGKKRFLAVCAGAAVLVFGIKVPLYSAIGVGRSESQKVETLGLPMTVIGAAVTYAPDKLDEETLEFAYSIAPKEVWEEEYVNGSYNEIKWHDSADNGAIDGYGASKVVSIMFSCFKKAPFISMSALVKLTDSAYSLSGDCGSFIGPNVSPEAYPYGIYTEGVPVVRGFCTVYRNIVSDYLKYPFLRLGLMHYILIAAALAVSDLKKLRDWKRIFFLFPALIYNFGTTLLLTTYEDAVRFFFYTFMLMPVLLVFVLKKYSMK